MAFLQIDYQRSSIQKRSRGLIGVYSKNTLSLNIRAIDYFSDIIQWPAFDFIAPLFRIKINHPGSSAQGSLVQLKHSRGCGVQRGCFGTMASIPYCIISPSRSIIPPATAPVDGDHKLTALPEKVAGCGGIGKHHRGTSWRGAQRLAARG